MTRDGSMANRAGLGLLGAILIAAGGAGLARGLGLFGAAAARQPVLDGGVTAFAEGTGWFWPVMAVAGIVVGIIGLSWLISLVRRNRIRRLRVDASPAGVTEVDGRPASDALAAQVAGYPAVRRAHATLRGSAQTPRLDLSVGVRGPAVGMSDELHELVTRLHDEAVPDLRTTLGLRRLPTLVRLSLLPGDRPRTVR